MSYKQHFFPLIYDIPPVKKPLQNVKHTKKSFSSGTQRVKILFSEWKSGQRGKNQWESRFPFNKFAIDTSVFPLSMDVCTPVESHKHVSISHIITNTNKREPCGNTEWGNGCVFSK